LRHAWCRRHGAPWQALCWGAVQGIVEAAQAVEAAIDADALAAWLARKTPEEGPSAAKAKVRLEQGPRFFTVIRYVGGWLYQLHAGHACARLDAGALCAVCAVQGRREGGRECSCTHALLHRRRAPTKAAWRRAYCKRLRQAGSPSDR